MTRLGRSADNASVTGTPIGDPRFPILGTARRVVPRAVLQLRLDSGQFGYVQYICPGWHAPVIRVLPGVYEEPLPGPELRTLVAGPSLFRTQYGIDREWRRSGARVVANLRVPGYEAGMPPFRMDACAAADTRCWVKLPDGGHLSNPQYVAAHPDVDFDALPLWAIPFFGTLSWQMETQWTPRDANLNGLNLRPRSRQPAKPIEPEAARQRRRVVTSYLAVFPTEQDASAAAEELGEKGLRAELRYDGDMEWFLSFRRPGLPDAETEVTITEVAARHRGYFDGNLVGPFA
jgi:hypothetical protein